MSRIYFIFDTTDAADKALSVDMQPRALPPVFGHYSLIVTTAPTLVYGKYPVMIFSPWYVRWSRVN